MATVELPLSLMSDNAATDVGAIWREAIDQYEDITKVKIESLTPAKNVDAVLSEIHERETKFQAYRHDKTKVDKFRTLVMKSLGPIEKVSSLVASAASVSFPPSVAIFTVVTYLIKAANAVSADYDTINGVFEELDSYLNRLKILEGSVPDVPELKTALVQVLTSVLIVCGISAKYVTTKRWVKGFQKLVKGEDDELKTAYTRFHTMVSQEEAAIRNATLVGVEQLKKEGSATHADLKVGLAVAGRTELNTETIITNTGRIEQCLKNQEVKEADKKVTIEREKILKSMSSLNFRDKQRDIFAKRHQGTGQWLLDTKEFQQWFKGGQNSTLWCPGIPGAGKTVMTSVAIDHVSETRVGKVAIAYLYCDYKDERTQSELELMSSLTRQLAEQTDALPVELKEFYGKNTRGPTENERLSFIRAISCSFETTYVFIDALDECPESNRENFLHFLKKIGSLTRFFITSRPHVNLDVEFINISRIDIFATDSDIETYLTSEISKSSKLARLITRDPQLKEDIVKSISSKAGGMFLLAHLQIGGLCKQSPKTVRRSLNTLPTGVSATYEDAIKRINDQSEDDAQLAMRVLSYVFFAKRPLEVEELLHALSVEAEDTALDETAFSEVEILLGVSAGLVTVDEESNTIRLVHYTLQEYLEKTSGTLFPDAEVEIAKTCLTYMSFDAFKSGPCSSEEAMHDRLQKYWFLDYACLNWGHHVRENQRPELIDSVLGFLADDQKLPCSVQVLCRSGSSLRRGYEYFPRQQSPLHVVAYWGLNQVLAFLLERNEDIDSRDSNGETALYQAATNGYEIVIRLLLQKGADIDTKEGNGRTPLHIAAKNGDIEVARLLLDNRADIEAKNSYKETPLHVASVYSQEAVVRVLLEKGADIEAKNAYRETPLHKAAIKGNSKVARLLLENGADIEAKNSCKETPLHVASVYSQEAVVRVLLEKGADIGAKNTDGETLLHIAALGGESEVVRLLLENGADIEAKNSFKETPLHVASLYSREAVVRVLLEKGADIEAKDNKGRPALYWAVRREDENMVQVLSRSSAPIPNSSEVEI